MDPSSLLACCCCPKPDSTNSLNIQIECNNVCCAQRSRPSKWPLLQRFASRFLRRSPTVGEGERAPQETSTSLVEGTVGLLTTQTSTSEISSSQIHGTRDGFTMAGRSGG